MVTVYLPGVSDPRHKIDQCVEFLCTKLSDKFGECSNSCPAGEICRIRYDLVYQAIDRNNIGWRNIIWVLSVSVCQQSKPG